MKNLALVAASLLLVSASASADRLYLAGDALAYGWSLDDAQALLSAPDYSNQFSGTIYLKGGQDFKLLTTTDFGNLEYGSAEDSENGKYTLAAGTTDEGYGKLRVAADGNYLITVDLDAMSATVELSAYQETPVQYSSLFMVGSATNGGWSVDEGTPMYQNPETPVEFSAKGDLLEGTFKITTAIKGGGTWNGKYWFFRNADNEALMTLDQEGDLQWNISEAGSYIVTGNVATGAISIKSNTDTSVADMAADLSEAVYYTIDGIKAENPAHGLYIRVQGGKASKVLLR